MRPSAIRHSGAQTETVPPSLVLITIGSVTGVSIAALALALVVAAWLRNRDVDQSGTRRARWAERGVAFVVALPALILPFVIRAAVIEGIAPATEVPDKLRSAKFYSDRKGDFGDELWALLEEYTGKLV